MLFSSAIFLASGKAYFTCGPNKTTSAFANSSFALSSGSAQISTSIPLFSASAFILFTNRLVDIPAAQHNKIFFISNHPSLFLKVFIVLYFIVLSNQ